MTHPVVFPGWPEPSWTIAAQNDGTVALRITERRHVTGMLDMTPEMARDLAAALIMCADEADPAVTP